ncbi:hypothetical protein [Flavobacterium helocola]|uniref:DUF4440 domain-containing protein n=1 Tax=Flavobacterium helocola TaxID=3139139 RepID=A0ABU9IAD7_9FLAO
MKLVRYIFFYFMFFNSYSQESFETNKFFNDVFKKRTDKLRYTENKFEDLEEIKSSLEQITTVSKMQLKNFPEILIDSISFTKEELENAFNEFKKNNDKLWAKNLIENGSYISRKKIDKIFKSSSKGWEYFHKNYGDDLFRLSKPIFVKGNTVCFFYSSSSCGNLCGTGSFDIFIKQNGEWIFYTSLSMWIS